MTDYRYLCVLFLKWDACWFFAVCSEVVSGAEHLSHLPQPRSSAWWVPCPGKNFLHLSAIWPADTLFCLLDKCYNSLPEFSSWTLILNRAEVTLSSWWVKNFHSGNSILPTVNYFFSFFWNVTNCNSEFPGRIFILCKFGFFCLNNHCNTI